jgi:hypothetical protein
MHNTRTAMDGLIAKLHNHNGIIMKGELDSLKSRALKLVETSRKRFDAYEAGVKTCLDEHLALAIQETADI